MSFLRHTGSIAALSVCFAAPSFAAVIGGGVIKVADTSTPIPGGSGNFTTFNASIGDPTAAPPSIGNGNICFTGNNGTTYGVYSFIGGTLSSVANNSTAIPNYSGNFEFFRSAVIGGTGSAFYGGPPGSSPVGIYTNANGTLQRVFDTQMAPPGQGNFSGFGWPVINGNVVSCFGELPGAAEGIYRASPGGPITTIADTSTAIPSGVGVFQFVNSILAGSGANVAFHGSGMSSQSGIYKSVGGVLSRVADRSMPMPGSAGNFGGFSNVSLAMDGTDVVFLGADPTNFFRSNVYAEVGGNLRLVARWGAARPGGGTFQLDQFSGLGIGGNLITFRDSGDRSIFAANVVTGTTTKIIGPGDLLLGKTVLDLAYGFHGQSGSNIAFWAKFTDNSSGIFTMAIPEPVGLSMLVPAIAMLRRRR